MRDALVVGINIYDRLPSLKSPSEDANAIARLLIEYGGFEVTPLPAAKNKEENATWIAQVGRTTRVTHSQLEDALIQLFLPKGRNIPDTALFFFSGHGLRREKGIQEGYLAVSDINTELGYWGVSLQWLRRLLEESPVRQQIIWLDCCYSGELFNVEEADPGNQGKVRDRCFIAASREYEQAYEERDGSHGVLSKALLEALDPHKQSDRVINNLTLTASISRALKGSIQRALFTNSGGQIILTQSQTAEEICKSVVTGICPYKGLSYFNYTGDDPKYFFGRAALIDQLIEKVRTENFLAVLGASGCGKTSVVRAGLLYQLQLGERLSGSEQWPLRIFRPGEHPHYSLASEFVDSKLPDVERLTQLTKTAETLRNKGANELYKLIVKLAGDGRMVLVVDQFEEVFTLCQNEAKRQQFFECLLGTLPLTGNKLCLIFVMRADFFSKCAEQEYAGLAEKIQENLVTVIPMNQAELEQVITEPAKQVGLEIEGRLITKMIDDVWNSPGSLPLLQYTLTELWQQSGGRRLELVAYNEMGDVRGTLAKQADAVYESLSSEEQAITRRIFLELTQLGEGTEDTRRQVQRQNLVTSRHSEALVNQVIRKLVDAKLIVTDKVIAKGAEASWMPVVDVAHEALIHHWPSLRNWIGENRDDLRFQRRLDDAAKHWESKKKPEGLLWRSPDLDILQRFYKRKRQEMTSLQVEFFQASIKAKEQSSKKLRDRFVAAFIFAVISVLAAIGAFYGFRQAKKNEGLANQQKEIAEEQAQIAIKAQKDAEKQAQIAQEARMEAERQARIVRTALSGQLAAQAQVALERHPQCSLLLAIEALNMTLREKEPRVPAAEEVLRQALARIGGIGLSGNIIDISPDSHWLVTAGEEGIVHLWDLTASDPSASSVVLRGHDGEIWALAISPDNHWLVTGSDDKTAHLWDLTDPNPTDTSIVLRGHEEGIFTVAFSPDSRWLVTGSGDKTARLWDLSAPDSTTMPIVLRGHEGGITTLAISSDSRWLVTGSGETTARLWDLNDSDPAATSIALHSHDRRITTVTISPDSRWLVAGSGDGITYLWDLTISDLTTPPIILRGHKQKITTIAISPDSRWLVTGSGDATARLWNLSASEPGATSIVLHGHDRRIVDITISSDNRWIVTGSEDGTARLWDLNASEPVATSVVLQGHEGGITAMAISPDNRWLITGSGDGTARLWNLSGAESDIIPIVLYGHEDWIRDVAISPDSRWLITGSRDGTSRLWDLTASNQTNTPIVLHSHEWEITTIAFSPDSRYLITGSEDGNTRLWDLNLPNPTVNPVVLRGHEGRISIVAISPDSRWLITSSAGYLGDGTARLWDLTSSDSTASPIVLHGHKGQISIVAISPDSRWLVTGSVGYFGDGTVRLWDLTAADPTASSIGLPGHEEEISTVAISGDSRWLVTGSRDGVVRLWDLTAADPAVPSIGLPGHEEEISTVAISGDSRWLVTGSRDGVVRLWDLTATDSAVPSIGLSGHEGGINTVAVSENSHWLVTGSEDGIVRLWGLTATTGLTVAPVVLGGHEERITTVAFSPDNRRLVSVSADGTARLWILELDELIRLACCTAGRNLSYIEWNQYFRKEKYRLPCPDMPMHPSVITMAQNSAKAGDIEEAVTIFQRALKLDPALDIDPQIEAHKWKAQGLVAKGKQLAQRGKIQKAITTYTEVQTLDPTLQISAESWNTLCRNGSLGGYAAKVMEACEQAVTLGPKNGEIRDSRGLARALTGDVEGAIKDFQIFIDWTKDEEKKSQRQWWIHALREGENPFTPDELERLRKSQDSYILR